MSTPKLWSLPGWVGPMTLSRLTGEAAADRWGWFWSDGHDQSNWVAYDAWGSLYVRANTLLERTAKDMDKGPLGGPASLVVLDFQRGDTTGLCLYVPPAKYRALLWFPPIGGRDYVNYMKVDRLLTEPPARTVIPERRS